MRKMMMAAAALAVAWAFGGSPANALEPCWPQCAFDKPSNAPAARSASARKSASRTASAAGSSFSYGEERPQRRGRQAAPTYSGGYSGGGSTGVASFYWQPQRVASGGWFNPNAMTAAHKTLPFGTRVRVTHLGNGRSVEVTINDRGPYIGGRIIDLSKAAAGVIGMQGQGIANVRMDVIGR